jgi:isopentenyl diphosphate isomerase/L-lactate dehydrogenase-like FMN-dependent dehydrogenase
MIADISKYASVSDLALRAKKRLPGFVWNQLDGAAGEGGGASRNEEAFGRILFRAHRLAGPILSTGVEIFGRTFDQPFGIAPMSLADSVWHGTDHAMADLAASQNIPLVLSTGASSPIERMAEIAGDKLWFQIYMRSSKEAAVDLLNRAWKAGVTVLVFTVDDTGERRWNAEIRASGSRWTLRIASRLLDAARHPSWALQRLINGPVRRANLVTYAEESSTTFPEPGSNAGLTWEDLKFIRDCWKGKLVIKGLMLPEDAQRAVAEGVDGVWVSNHGGRHLESLPATIDVVRTIRERLGPQMPIMLDSGIRTGESVLKSLALGATMAFAGRPFLYGAGAFGPRGVKHAFDILASEVRVAMRQVGCSAPSELEERAIAKP